MDDRVMTNTDMTQVIWADVHCSMKLTEDSYTCKVFS